MAETNLQHIPEINSPFWCFNGHIHTIAQSFFSNTTKPEYERIEIPTPDGDFLELDVINRKNAKGVIALFHGLEGSTDRYYIVELMNKLSEHGYAVAAVNFRSCGSKMNRKRKFYHSGETEDFVTTFNWMKKNFPKLKIGAVGFSLGANALLKYLSENNDSPLKAAVAVSAPYNLKAGSLKIGSGFNRIYEYYFLRSLRKKLKIKRKKYTDLPKFTGSSLYDFDDQITSKIHGFKDAEDYYKQCSSAQFIQYIRLPTLLIHSKQDPLCPVEEMPLSDIKRNPFTDFIIADQGGHVGFYHSSCNWLNKRIVTYIRKKLCNSN